MNIKTGFGIDFHQLVEHRDLWLGGIKIPHLKGALGHSDADVLLHAVCDALLGAAALGDIGVHFPDTSNEFKDIDSKILLKRTIQLIVGAGYKVGNIDASLCLQAPKIKSYVPQMQQIIAEISNIPVNKVSIKATTAEKLGFIGREEGVVAYASALLLPADLKIKIVNQSNNPLPAYETRGASGMDIRAFVDAPVTLQPLERKLIPTGLFIELPEGHEAQIRPRSGLAIKQGLTCLNTPGTIDADYRGEIKVIIINLSNETHTIQNGDRIAQMVIQQVEQATWIDSDSLNSTKRGEGGFGHTGI